MEQAVVEEEAAAWDAASVSEQEEVEGKKEAQALGQEAPEGEENHRAPSSLEGREEAAAFQEAKEEAAVWDAAWASGPEEEAGGLEEGLPRPPGACWEACPLMEEAAVVVAKADGAPVWDAASG